MTFTQHIVGASRFSAHVARHQRISGNYFRLTLHSPWQESLPRAGQFVHIAPPAYGAFDPLLRRAFSIAHLNLDEKLFDVVYRVGGKGTTALSRARVNDTLDVLGPLGSPFFVSSAPLWMVGGGVGVPPLAMLAQQQSRMNELHQSSRVFVGARNSNELLCIDDFKNHKLTVWTATEDGSDGVEGFVTHLVESHLEDNRANGGVEPLVCACGPLAMLKAVALMCERFAVPCQVSLEENMPCGIGVCNGCVVGIKDAGDEYGRYRRVCIEGPAMWAHEINW